MSVSVFELTIQTFEFELIPNFLGFIFWPTRLSNPGSFDINVQSTSLINRLALYFYSKKPMGISSFRPFPLTRRSLTVPSPRCGIRHQQHVSIDHIKDKNIIFYLIKIYAFDLPLEYVIYIYR